MLNKVYLTKNLYHFYLLNNFLTCKVANRFYVPFTAAQIFQPSPTEGDNVFVMCAVWAGGAKVSKSTVITSLPCACLSGNIKLNLEA